MNNQYNQQPQYQQQYAPQPRMPMIDPMVAKQQKKDAFNALSDKIAAFMQTNPVLKAIVPFSDVLSFCVTAVSVLMTIIAMCLGGSSQIFAVAALVFGFISLSKKNLLPLTVALSVMSLFNVIGFIMSIVRIADLAQWGIVSGSSIIGLIFSIIELALIGGLTALSWVYFLAMLPPRMYQPMQQPYVGQPMQQPMQQPVQQQPMQQPIQQQPIQQQPVQQPVQQPMQQLVQQQAESVSVQKTCPACGSANVDDADFCKICGTKL